MSASTRPTFLPSRASATARLAETVDLPTPPLPLPTAMIVRSQLLGGHRDPGVGDARARAIIAARTWRSSSARCSAERPVASSTTVATPSFSRAIATRPARRAPRPPGRRSRPARRSGRLVAHRGADRQCDRGLALFFRQGRPYKSAHETNFRVGPRARRRRSATIAAGPGDPAAAATTAAAAAAAAAARAIPGASRRRRRKPGPAAATSPRSTSS